MKGFRREVARTADLVNPTTCVIFWLWFFAADIQNNVGKLLVQWTSIRVVDPGKKAAAKGVTGRIRWTAD